MARTVPSELEVSALAVQVDAQLDTMQSAAKRESNSLGAAAPSYADEEPPLRSQRAREASFLPSALRVPLRRSLPDTPEQNAAIERLRQCPQASAPEQRAVIERETGEQFVSFWKRYLWNGRRDLCLPGGVLHDQWQKWQKLESKATVRQSYGWVAAMGLPAHSIDPVVIAASVFLINALANIGIKTICEGCGEKK